MSGIIWYSHTNNVRDAAQKKVCGASCASLYTPIACFIDPYSQGLHSLLSARPAFLHPLGLHRYSGTCYAT